MIPVVNDPDFALFEGDALNVLKEISPLSVDAIVTSPPYGDQRPGTLVELDNYVEWITPFLEALYRVLKPEGSMMLNLGRIFRGGEEHPYHELTMLRARELGWLRIDTLIWHKLNAHPFVAPQYLHNKHEVAYWLAPTSGAYRGYDADTRRPAAQVTVERRERAGLRGPKNLSRNGYVPTPRTALNPDGVKPASVFGCNVGREKGIKHDSPMALEFARHLVALTCPPGGLVLDPFAGSGTTGVAARRLSRRCILIDRDPDAVSEATVRVARWWDDPATEDEPDPDQQSLLSGDG